MIDILFAVLAFSVIGSCVGLGAREVERFNLVFESTDQVLESVFHEIFGENVCSFVVLN